jgi:hypothetical protein
MQFVVAFAKKLPWVSIGLFFGGLLLGLLFGYVIAPLQFIDATPDVLRADLQEDYLRMTLDSYRLTGDPNQAVQRWQALGANAPVLLEKIKNDPRGLPQNTIQSYAELIIKVLGSTTPAPVSTNSTSSTILWVSIGLILLVGGVAAFIYLRQLLANRGSGVTTVTMQAAELSKSAEKTNFESLGLAPPITQIMTTYVLGDDLYDESFSIDAPGGDFLGEYGVGVSETIGVGDPKKVTALEFWLFDKNDIKTATKVLMSAHAFNDPAIRARLEPKGELVLIEPQKQIILETATLQLLATVVDLTYGTGPLPDKSHFERVTLELAIWPKGA